MPEAERLTVRITKVCDEYDKATKSYKKGVHESKQGKTGLWYGYKGTVEGVEHKVWAHDATLEEGVEYDCEGFAHEHQSGVSYYLNSAEQISASQSPPAARSQSAPSRGSITPEKRVRAACMVMNDVAGMLPGLESTSVNTVFMHLDKAGVIDAKAASLPDEPEGTPESTDVPF